jgi:uncharacterized membrane protein
MDNQDDSFRAQEEVRADRVTAFSDSVFAFAITLLVITIHAPLPAELGRKSLLLVLGQQWPNYLSYVLSFIQVGQVWANHHTMFTYIKRANHVLIVLNTLLLMNIAVLPFPTALLALYIGTHEQYAAVLVYSGTLAVGGIFYNALWWYAARHHDLLDPTLDRQVVHRVTRRYLLGPTLYALAFGLSFFWNGTVSLVLCAFLITFYLLPTVAGRMRINKRDGWERT